jgi:FAD synthase
MNQPEPLELRGQAVWPVDQFGGNHLGGAEVADQIRPAGDEYTLPVRLLTGKPHAQPVSGDERVPRRAFVEVAAAVNDLNRTSFGVIGNPVRQKQQILSPVDIAVVEE